jgi:serine/threonine-protein kinase
MSPEQVRSAADVDPRADLWSLAALAYRCLTGEYPFPGADVYAVMRSICDHGVVPPSRRCPGLPREIDRFFERALAKDRAGRFQSAAELVAAFADAAGVKVAESVLSRSSPEDTAGGLRSELDTVTPRTPEAGPDGGHPHAPGQHGAPSPPSQAPSKTEDTTGSLSVTADSVSLFSPARRTGTPRTDRAGAEPSPREGEMAGMSSTATPKALAPSRLSPALGALVLLGFTGTGLIVGMRVARFSPAAPTAIESQATTAQTIAVTVPASGHPEPAVMVVTPATAVAPVTTVDAGAPRVPWASKVQGIKSPPIKPAECVPPYVIDGAGYRHIKKQCL